MTDAPKPTLTEAEMDSLLSVYQSPSTRRWPRLLAVIRGVVATHVAAARREALLEAADAYYALGRRFNPRTGEPECQCVQDDLNRPCYCDAYEWLRDRAEERA